MTNNSDKIFKSLLTSSGILVVGLAFQMGLGFLGRLIIARFLGKVNYGGVSLGVTLMMAASVVVVLGFDNGVGRYLPRYDERKNRKGVILSAYQIVVPLAAVIGLLVVIFAEFIASFVFNTPEFTEVIRIFGLAIPFAAFVRLTVGSIRGMKEVLPRVYIENIALPIVRFLLIALAITLGFEGVGVAWAYAGAYGLAAAFSVYYLWKKTPLWESCNSVAMHKELLVFSTPLMVSATMNVLFSNIDTFMLGAFSSPGAVGIYNSVYPLANLQIIFLTAFNFVFMPMISELHSNAEHGQLKRVYQVISKWIFMMTLPIFIALAFYPEFIINLTFGSEYIDGGTALSILALGYFTHTIVGPTGNTLMALGRSRLIMYIDVLVSTVNIGLNILLIPRYSFVGAAVATVVGYIMMNGLYIFFLWRDIGIHPFRAEVGKPAVASLLLWVGIYIIVQQFSLNSLMALLGSFFLFLPLYGAIILRFGGIEHEELAILKSFETKLGINLNPLWDIAKRIMG